MRHLKVIWVHEFPDEPHVLYYEADAEDEIIRNMALYPDGSFGLASGETEFGGCIKPEAPLSPLAEIREEGEFYPFVISDDEFNRIWKLLSNRMTAEPL